MFVDSSYPLTSPFYLRDQEERAPSNHRLPKVRRRNRCASVIVATAGLLLWSIGVSTDARSEEPAKRFLERLKEEGLYDQALKYLEIGQARNRLPKAMVDDIQLERIVLMQDSLKTARTAQQAEERYAKIEQGYKDFLAGSADHPRRSESRLKLADLYFFRGQTALNAGNKEQARVAFNEASKVFSDTIEELRPKLDAMQGANIKSNETDKLELRERYRTDYRQAEIFSGLTMRFIAETYPAESPEWKDWLGKAETKLSDVVEKASGTKEAGRRMLSLLNRGHVQSLLGKIDEARESYNRVADNEEPGIFRTWRVQAVAGIVRLDSTEKSGKYEAAIQRGLELYKTSELRERDEPEWLELQLAIAKARLNWIKAMNPQTQSGPIRNLKREARDALQELSKHKGEHQAETKKLLSEIGIEKTEKVDTKLPETKTFVDTVKAARERLDRAESGDAALEILKQQLEGLKPDEIAKVQADIDTTNGDMLRDRTQAIELYRRAQTQFREKDSREDLVQARFLLAYLLLKTDRYWEATAVAQMIMQTAKGTDSAKRSSSFAMIGLSKLVAEGTKERQTALIPILEKLATWMISNAPDLPETENAVELLIKLALMDQRYDDAERYAELQGDKVGPSGVVLGRIFWSKYRVAMSDHRKNSTTPSPEELKFKDRAYRLLNKGWLALDAQKVDKTTVEGVNTLVALLLAGKQLDEAERVLNDPARGAIAIGKKVDELDPAVQLESYRLQLQAMVQAAGQGKSQLSGKEVGEAVETMKRLSSGAGNEDLLTNSLRSLAAEVQEQLSSTTDMTLKSKLAEAFRVLIEQLVDVGDDPSIIDSAGTTMYGLAVELEKTPTLASNTKGMMAVAEKAFAKLSTKSVADLEAAKRKPEEVLLKLALARRGSGKYAEANKIFVELLAKNASNITVQVEATKNLEQWSEGKNADLVKKAMLGAEPNEQRKNQIWGWGQIAAVTSKFQNFREIFFEARFNVAKCRKMLGDIETDPKKKTELLSRALEDIRQTYKPYPDLGGEEFSKRFDTLARDLQTVLKKPNVGLDEFK